MKKNNIITFLQRVAICLVAFAAFSCSEDNDIVMMKQGEGEMIFTFKRRNGYTLDELNEISTVKITVEKDGIRQELKSLKMSGTSDSISSEGIYLEAGNYRVIKYKAFDAYADMIYECEPEKKNEFITVQGKTEEFSLPVMVYVKIDKNNFLNTMYAICTEAFGEDRTLWPATWNEDTDLLKWEGLEFEEDDYGNASYLIGMTLDSNFGPMKRLSPAITNFSGLNSLIIRNNNLEELPDNFGALNLNNLQIINTNLSYLPEDLARMRDLGMLYLSGNKFTQVPEVIFTQKVLRILTIENENISEIPAEIGKLNYLDALNLKGLNITELPDVFGQLWGISSLDISNNAGLTTLPASLAEKKYGNQGSYLKSIWADGCGFTSLPEQVLNDKFITLSFSNNKISNLEKSEMELMTNVETLYLSGNKLSTFPSLEMPKLRMLVLIDCGLSADQVDRTGIPNMYTTSKDESTGEVYNHDMLFLTQEQFDNHFFARGKQF